MISLKEIERFYPEKLRPFRKGILREYLQHKILEIVFDSVYATKLSFIGGTALRIMHGNTRFSEDIDFDNFGLTIPEFEDLSKIIKKGLELEGYDVEIRNVYKNAFHCNIKLPDILFYNNISGHKKEKILIQLDTAYNDFKYNPEIKLLDKFDVFTEIRVAPLDVILSQKIVAIFERKRTKGRDFFDVVFLFGLAKPSYKYLEKKIGIKDKDQLKKSLSEKAKESDLNHLAKDVEKFLFDPKDSKRIVLFDKFIQQKL